MKIKTISLLVIAIVAVLALNLGCGQTTSGVSTVRSSTGTM